MNPITRRQLLRTSGLVPVAAIAACSGIGAVVTDPAVGALLTALKPWIDGLGVLPAWLTGAVNPALISQVTGLVSQLVNLGGQIASVTSISGAVPLLGSLSTIFGDIVAALPVGALPANVMQLLSAAATYLPTILAIAGLFAQRAPLMAALGPMSTDQALAILRAAAASR